MVSDPKSRKTGTPADFNLENPELSPTIAKKALESGGYPYSEKLRAKPYKKELLALQLELLKLQEHIQEATSASSSFSRDAILPVREVASVALWRALILAMRVQLHCPNQPRPNAAKC